MNYTNYLRSLITLFSVVFVTEAYTVNNFVAGGEYAFSIIYVRAKHSVRSSYQPRMAAVCTAQHCMRAYSLAASLKGEAGVLNKRKAPPYSFRKTL